MQNYSTALKPMEFTAKQIAQVVNGEIVGDENAVVSSFAKIEEGRAGAISFLSNPKYTHYIYQTEASVVLVNKDTKLEKPVKATLIKVDNAYECVAKLLQMYEAAKPKKTGIDPLAFVSPDATMSAHSLTLVPALSSAAERKFTLMPQFVITFTWVSIASFIRKFAFTMMLWWATGSYCIRDV